MFSRTESPSISSKTDASTRIFFFFLFDLALGLGSEATRTNAKGRGPSQSFTFEPRIQRGGRAVPRPLAYAGLGNPAMAGCLASSSHLLKD